MAWWRRKQKKSPDSNGPDRESPGAEGSHFLDDSSPRDVGVPEGFVVVDEDAARPANDPTRSPFWRDSHPEHRFFALNPLKREDLHSPPPGISPARRTLYEIIDTGLIARAGSINLEPYLKTFRVRFHLQEGWKTVMEGEYSDFKAICEELGSLVFGKPDALYETVFHQIGATEIDYQNGEFIGVVCKSIWGTDGPIVNIYFQSSGEKGFVLDLDNLGIREPDLVKIKRALDRPKGLILVCGPTGAGKSVLCYSSLVRAQLQGRRVVTLERPKKFVLPGAVQVGVEPRHTFRDGLDKALAHDPDVLMFQDISDNEDLLPALQQADQRLVICGYHRWSAISALRSLFQSFCLGLDKDKDHSEYLSPGNQIRPEALAQRLLLVTGSRLLSRLCPHCKTGKPFEANFVKRAGIKAVEGLPLAHYFTTGCEACGQTGYAGIESVFEVLEVTPVIREMISRFNKDIDTQDCPEKDYERPEQLLEARAIEEGMRPMYYLAMDKVLEGRIKLRHVLMEIPKPYGPIGESTEEKS